jgi:virulence factor Mce-like protein
VSRRGNTGWRAFAGDTLVIGLVALAVVAVAVAISYRAQNGLPWASVYRVHADVPDGAKLLKNADVRIGGARVGQVLGIHAEPGQDGRPPFTRLDLALDADAGPLPADTTSEVRLASVLGGKFLDLVPGDSDETIPDGGVIALENAKPAIDTDEALLVFGPESRTAIRALVSELGTSVAGRGTALNQTIETAARALPAADRVLGVLAASDTDLAGFVRGAASAAAALEPVSGRLGGLIGDSATTFAALDDDALDQVLAAAPGAELATTEALDAVGPVLDDAAAITRSLAPAGAVLETSLARIDSAVRSATPVTRRVGRLAAPMDSALRAVDAFARNPAASGAIRALGGNDLATFGGSAFIGLGAILRTTSAAQLHCNAAALWMRNLASIASEGDSGGNWLRMIPVFGFSQFTHAATPAEDLHVNYYPRENAQECESGNEPYAPGQAIGNPPGRQAQTTQVTTQEETG